MSTLAQADLVKSLRARLGDAAAKFTDPDHGDIASLIDRALLDFSRKRPRLLRGSVTLIADVSVYTPPAGCLRVERVLWGEDERRRYRQWDRLYPGAAPRVSIYEGEAGARALHISPAPTGAQITQLGTDFAFHYQALHLVDPVAANTTVQAADRELLLTRALAVALFDLAASGSVKPVALGPGVGAMPKNGSAAALAEAALNLFEHMAH